MAAPFDRDYLEKLRSFIDFAIQNPLILNVPQLDFVKKFVEEFGGRVPVGEFKMRAGEGMPVFNDDTKAEPRNSTHSVLNNESSQMFEVEDPQCNLDMEAGSASNRENGTVASENVIYLEETRYKRCMPKKRPAPKKTKRSLKKPLKAYRVKKSVQAIKEEPKLMEVSVDPLSTEDISLKTEPLDEDDKSAKLSASTDSEDYENDENNFELDSEEDDEPLIMMIRKRGRPSKNINKHDWSNEGKVKTPRPVICREMCKQKCVQKFTEAERKLMCNHFWKLTNNERIQYIRMHSRSKRFTRLKRKRERKRGNNCVYFLEIPTQEKTEPIRVCRSYFEATLSLTHYNIKKALDGYEPEPEQSINRPFLNIKAEKNTKQKNQHTNKVDEVVNKEAEIEQTLDPVTGNLITVHPASFKDDKEFVVADGCGKMKKKRIRKDPKQPIERVPKRVNCAERCIYKCHINFTEEQRKQICSTFWSMDYKRRKDFILSRVETRPVETETTPEFRKSNRPPRTYHTRFFLRTAINGENLRVCKDFLMATLCISRHFITNALEFADQTTGYYTGGDRRGHHTPGNKISEDRIQEIRRHIESYPTWVPNKKSKTRYLHSSLTIKRLYNEYKEKCMREQKQCVSNNFFYGIFHNDFKLAFLKPIISSTASKTKCPKDEKHNYKGLTNLNPNISVYTGEEPGGFWRNALGERIDPNIQNVMATESSSVPMDHANKQIHLTSIATAAATATAGTANVNIQKNPITSVAPYTNHAVNYSGYFSGPQQTNNVTNTGQMLTPALSRPDIFNPSVFDAAHASTMFRIL